MSPAQLTLDGRMVEHPTPRAHVLTARQRDLIRWVRYSGVVYTKEAALFYADPRGALRRLERLGLVVRLSRSRWAAVKPRTTT